jgi:hypothetical protein
MNAYGGVDVKVHAFSFSTLDEQELSALHSRRLTSDSKDPQYPLDMGIGGPYSRLDTVIEIYLHLPRVKPLVARHVAISVQIHTLLGLSS